MIELERRASHSKAAARSDHAELKPLSEFHAAYLLERAHRPKSFAERAEERVV